MDLSTFKMKFNEIRKMGFVRTARRGNTGVGHTLETLLGIEENNIALSDLAIAELKAHRSGSNSMITLFTLDRGAWVIDQLDAIQRFGSDGDPGRRNLYMTLAAGKGGASASLLVEVDDHQATVQDPAGTIVAKWRHEELAERFDQKFPALMLVSADVQHRFGDEWFHYNKATLLQGTSSKKLELGLKKGSIVIDLRLHHKSGIVRNHGTGFRIQEVNLSELFEERIEI